MRCDRCKLFINDLPEHEYCRYSEITPIDPREAVEYIAPLQNVIKNNLAPPKAIPKTRHFDKNGYSKHTGVTGSIRDILWQL